MHSDQRGAISKIWFRPWFEGPGSIQLLRFNSHLRDFQLRLMISRIEKGWHWIYSAHTALFALPNFHTPCIPCITLWKHATYTFSRLIPCYVHSFTLKLKRDMREGTQSNLPERGVQVMWLVDRQAHWVSPVATVMIRVVNQLLTGALHHGLLPRIHLHRFVHRSRADKCYTTLERLTVENAC